VKVVLRTVNIQGAILDRLPLGIFKIMYNSCCNNTVVTFTVVVSLYNSSAPAGLASGLLRWYNCFLFVRSLLSSMTCIPNVHQFNALKKLLCSVVVFCLLGLQ
jgi:hypothetical protein